MAGETILVVEDEPLVGIELQEWLIDLGYTVPEVVADGSKVIGVTKEIRPDLILMDIRINGAIDGIQAAGEVRRTSDIPIIFLTAYSDPDTVARVIQVRSNGMMLKPFRERELEINVALALEKAKERKSAAKQLLPWRSMVETLEQAVILFDENGRWLHANPEARNSIGGGWEGFTLAAVLGVSAEAWAADPGSWLGREFPLTEPASDWVFTLAEIGAGPDYDGFLMCIHPMEKQEREHLRSSIQNIHDLLSGFVPQADLFPERLFNDGFLVPRPSGTGDSYDLFPLGPHHFLFYSLDVSGHGLLSSMAIASLRGMIRELAGNALVRTNEIPSPADLLNTLNHRFLGSNPSGPMFTIALGILAPSSGDVVLVRAGHPAPLVVDREGNFRLLGTEGPALGVFPEVDLKETEDRLRRGERLFLPSDGVLERLGDKSLVRGLEVLAGLVAGQKTLGSQIQAVREECLEVPGLQTDDLSLMGLEPKLW